MNKTFTKEDTLLVKGIAILFMLFYHLFETYERVDSLGVIYAPLSEDIFLMISGFGILKCLWNQQEAYKP